MQYSLRRLLFNLTALCVVCATVAAFPQAALSITLLLLLYAPTLIVMAVACALSPHWMRTLVVVSAGAFAGWLLTPRMLVSWGAPPSFWDLFLVEFQTTGLGAFVGSALFAIGENVYANHFRLRTKRRQGSQL